MAIHRLSIFSALVPDANVFPEPLTVKGTNDLSRVIAWMFPDIAGDSSFDFAFSIPKNFVSAPKVVARILANATSGNFIIEAAMRGIADGESLDPTTYVQTVASATTAVPGTALLMKDVSLTFTAGNFAADDLVLGAFKRKTSDGGDTLAADLGLIDLLFEYADA
jgi:hypothetical protein